MVDLKKRAEELTSDKIGSAYYEVLDTVAKSTETTSPMSTSKP